MGDSILDGLSAEQAAAVASPATRTSINASPGSGKTRSLVGRVQLLAQQGHQPEQIVVVTFTRQARGEMDLQIRRTCGGPWADRLMLGTFHWLANRLLRLAPEVVGLTSAFGMVGPDQHRQWLREILDQPAARASLQQARISADDAPKAVGDLVARSYHQGLSIDQCAALGAHGPLAAAARFELEQLEVAHDAIGLDHLVPAAVAVLDEPDLAASIRRQISQVLVDETQDANPVQIQLLDQLAGPDGCLWAIGDSDQSIYGFRDADPDGMARLIAQAPNGSGAAMGLSCSRRFGPRIAEVAERLISSAPGRPARPPVQAHDPDKHGIVRAAEFATAEEERQKVVAGIRQVHDDHDIPWREFLVIAAQHWLLSDLDSELLAHGVPHSPSDGVRLAGRAHIAPVLHSLRLICGQPITREQLRVVLEAQRDIGEQRAIALVDALGDRPLEGSLETVRLPTQVRDRVQAWQQELASMARQAASRQGPSPRRLFEQLLASAHGPIAHQQQLAESGSDRQADLARGRVRDLERFRSACLQLLGTRCSGLVELVDELERQAASDPDDGTGGVRLNTVHGAKGQEARVVICLGMEEGQLPSRHARSPQAIDEARRCAYVALTRARGQCVFTHTQRRRRDLTRPSRFLAEAGLT